MDRIYLSQTGVKGIPILKYLKFGIGFPVQGSQSNAFSLEL
jgi:hypothetical protein